MSERVELKGCLNDVLNKLERLDNNTYIHQTKEVNMFFQYINEFNEMEKFFMLVAVLDNPKIRTDLKLYLKRIKIEEIFTRNE